MRIGSGENTYEWIDNWARLPKNAIDLNESAHSGIVVTDAGNIMTFHEADHAVITLDKDGRLQNSWATELENAHDVVLVKEDGSEYLWLADNKSAQVIKTTLDGETVMSLQQPAHSAYRDGKYSPTSVTVNPESTEGHRWTA